MNFDEFKATYLRDKVIEIENSVHENVQRPIISVVICTYQQIKYISQTIEGVLMQKTSFPIEIIIGDDDSNDGTREKCVEYAMKYPNLIRLFLHSRKNNIVINGKPTVTFQYLYNCFSARGTYIASIAGDDYWTDPKKLQKQYDFLSRNLSFSASYHSFYILEELDRSSRTGLDTITESEKLYYPDEHLQNSKRPLTLMYKNIFETIPKQFAEVLAEDVFLRFILETEGPIKYQPEIDGAVYRVHKNSVWNSSTKEFKLNNSVETYSKIHQAYFGTPHENIAAVLLTRSLVRKRLYNSKERKENRIMMLFNLKKEFKNNNVGLVYFIHFIIWEIKVWIKHRVSRIVKFIGLK